MRAWAAKSLLIAATITAPCRAHFVWIVPDGRERHSAKVIFSEDLTPDEGVPIEKIAATEFRVRDDAGNVSTLKSKKGDHVYLLNLADKRAAVIGGICTYGVTQRGQGKPFLLIYHPKLICGNISASKPWDELQLEIVPKGDGRFQVVYSGKPVADTEVVTLGASEDSKTSKLQTGDNGEFTLPPHSSGLCGIRARYVEPKTGEHSGKKYEEVRHYATLVFQLGENKPPMNDSSVQDGKGMSEPAPFPPLPIAVSSFGAAVSDSWLYVYGGHCAKTHRYSTESALGTFHRINLSDPRAWEELPSGPTLQGLALVAHGGMIYRIGGMQSRNKKGEQADNQSIASCSRFNPGAMKWERLPDLPGARSSHDAIVAGDKLVVVGGWRMNGGNTQPDWHDDALILDLKAAVLEWKSVPQPFRRRALTAATHGGNVYVVGGISDESVPELTVNAYDPRKNTWKDAAPIPGPRQNGFAPATVATNHLYVSTADGRVFRLARDGANWDEVGRLKQPRIVHRMIAAADDMLIVVGGAHSGDNIAATEIFRPELSTPTTK